MSEWTCERHMTRSRKSTMHDASDESDIVEVHDVINAISEPDPRNYGETMKISCKGKWVMAIDKELKALEANGVWVVVVPPVGSHVLHNKWVFKTKIDADGNVERYKARLVACGNEQLFGIDYTLTFAAVMELDTVKIILVLSRRRKVPVRHEDALNAYVKAEKEKDLDI